MKKIFFLFLCILCGQILYSSASVAAPSPKTLGEISPSPKGKLITINGETKTMAQHIEDAKCGTSAASVADVFRFGSNEFIWTGDLSELSQYAKRALFTGTFVHVPSYKRERTRLSGEEYQEIDAFVVETKDPNMARELLIFTTKEVWMRRYPDDVIDTDI